MPVAYGTLPSPHDRLVRPRADQADRVGAVQHAHFAASLGLELARVRKGARSPPHALPFLQPVGSLTSFIRSAPYPSGLFHLARCVDCIELVPRKSSWVDQQCPSSSSRPVRWPRRTTAAHHVVEGRWW